MRNRIHIEPGSEQAVKYRLLKRLGLKLGRAVAAATPSSVSHPLALPTLSGTTITVDTMLQQPTRITRMIMDLTLQRFVADRVFANGGGVTGGSVIFDKVQANELYATRDVERVEPGQEFPLITGDRRAPSIAPVEKWGGKVYIDDEARDRNDTALLTNLIRQIGNTVVRKINARAINALEASITSSGRTIVGRSWGAVTFTGPDASTTTAQNSAARDFALAAKQTEVDELGFTLSLWLINPAEYANLIIAYGEGLNSLLNRFNIEIFVSNRVTAGTAYVVAPQQVGQIRIEKPLGSETWREQKTERTWIQSSVRPLFFVDNDFAVVKFTGLT